MKYRVISTDDHFVEPGDLWQSRVPDRMKDAAPKVLTNEEGFECWYMDNKLVRPVGVSSLAGRDKSAPRVKTYEEMRPGCYIASERLKDMELDGVDAQVLYPNVAGLGGQGLLHIEDLEVRLTCIQAYNDGLADWCSVAPDQFVPNCLIPMWDISLIPAEVERAVEIGHRGIVFAGSPQNLGHPPIWDHHWDPLWAAAQDADVPVALHVGGNAPTGDPSRARASQSRPTGIGGLGAVYTIASNIEVMCNILFTGVFTRFPKLKIVSVESGLGWIPYLLELSDHQWEEYQMGRQPEFKTRPSELFRDHVYTNVWFEKEGIKDRSYIGLKNIMWECDYPHPTGIWPNTRKYIDEVLEGVPEDEREMILWKNAAELYHLPADG